MINYSRLLVNEFVFVPLESMEPFIQNLDIPKKQLSREIKKVNKEIYSSYLPEVVFDVKTCKYSVVGNYTTYYAYQHLYPKNRLILCKVFYDLEESEKYLITIDWMMKHRITNWYDRRDIITKLIYEFNLPKSELTTYLNKKKRH